MPAPHFLSSWKILRLAMSFVQAPRLWKKLPRRYSQIARITADSIGKSRVSQIEGSLQETTVDFGLRQTTN